MTSAPLFIASIVLILLAYFTYGRVIRRWLGVDPSRPTPAHSQRDDVDYVPARRAVLVGHHFASIAGAAPIIGPVTAIAYGTREDLLPYMREYRNLMEVHEGRLDAWAALEADEGAPFDEAGLVDLVLDGEPEPALAAVAGALDAYELGVVPVISDACT